jgi:hypothetical protein
VGYRTAYRFSILDCPRPALIVGDFSKGLGAAVAAKATADLEGVTLTDKVLSRDPADLVKATEVIVGEATGKPTPIELQLCKWHTVEAIKQRFSCSWSV